MVSEQKIPPKSADYGSPRTAVDDPGFADVKRHLDQAREQAGRYVTAQLDRVRALVRNVVLFGVLAAAGAVIGATVLVTAAVLLCVGTADGIGELLGGRLWAGDLIVGGVVLAIIVAGGFLFVRRIVGSARRQTMQSYEKRKTGEPL
jgi:hypothetical protein